MKREIRDKIKIGKDKEKELDPSMINPSDCYLITDPHTITDPVADPYYLTTLLSAAHLFYLVIVKRYFSAS